MKIKYLAYLFIMVLIFGIFHICPSIQAADNPFLSVGVENNVNYGQNVEWYIDGVLYETEYIEAWGIESQFFSQNWALTDGWGTYYVEVKASDGNSNSQYVIITQSDPSVFITLPIKQATPSNAILTATYAITNINGEEISQISYGETVIVKITIENTGDTTSDYTDIWVDVMGSLRNAAGDKEGGFAVLKTIETIQIQPGETKEFTATWKTDAIIGSSIYYANPGTLDITVAYAPTDYNIEETDDNSDYLSGKELTITPLEETPEEETPSEESSTDETPGFEITTILIATILAFTILSFSRRRKI